jgi:hypothetical protein
LLETIMQLVEVKITSTVVTAPYGTLTSGTILRTSPAYAKHLVEDAFAAIYLTAPAASAEPPAKRSKKQTETEK